MLVCDGCDEYEAGQKYWKSVVHHGQLHTSLASITTLRQYHDYDNDQLPCHKTTRIVVIDNGS